MIFSRCLTLRCKENSNKRIPITMNRAKPAKATIPETGIAARCFKRAASASNFAFDTSDS